MNKLDVENIKGDGKTTLMRLMKKLPHKKHDLEHGLHVLALVKKIVEYESKTLTTRQDNKRRTTLIHAIFNKRWDTTKWLLSLLKTTLTRCNNNMFLDVQTLF